MCITISAISLHTEYATFIINDVPCIYDRKAFDTPALRVSLCYFFSCYIEFGRIYL